MNRYFSTLLAFSLSILSLVAQKERQTFWAKSPILIDGKLNDWKTPLRYFDATSQIGYSIANDSTHLYFSFSVPIHIIHIKMIRNGFEVRIDTLGKKKGQASITFPVGNNERTDFERLRTQMSGDQDQINHEKSSVRLRYLMQPQIMNLAGLKSTNGLINQKEPHSVKGRIDWDDQYNMIYELAIPFKEIIGRNITEKDTKKSWMLIASSKEFKFDNSKDPALMNYSSNLIEEQRFFQTFFLSLQ